MQQQNFSIKITASRLSFELGLHGEKNFNGNSGNTFNTTIKSEI